MFTKKNTYNVQKNVLKNYPSFDGFEIMRLRDFLDEFLYEIHKQYLFYNMKKRNYKSNYEIFCLVDCIGNSKTSMNSKLSKKYRRSNSKTRNRMKKHYHYSNIFNRIHGYIILEDLSESEDTPISKKIVSLSLICSSKYSNKKGIGSCLMKFMKEICKISGFTDIILEVSNEFASGVNAEIEEIFEDSSDDEDYEEEVTGREIYNDFIVDKLTDEFHLKSLRHRINEKGIKEDYYNVGNEYIYKIIYSYINDIKYEYEDNIFDFTPEKVPEVNEYGGYYYMKGKISQIGLYKFYQKFGFKELPEINYKWKIYTSDPLPTMICNI